MDTPAVPPPPPPPQAPPAGPAPPREGGRGVVTGLTCPSCGGTLEVEEGRTNLLCRYCETPLLVLGERGVARLMVMPELDREAAAGKVRSWFRSGVRKARRLPKEARIEEAFLAFFPFVRVRFDVVGWVLGVVRRMVERDGRRVEVVEPKELMIQRTIDRTAAAAEMAEFGVRRVDLHGDRLLPYDEEALRRRGMVFRLQLEPEEVERSVAAEAMEQVKHSAVLDRVTFSWLQAVRRRVTVVHYPMWVFRYGFRGRTYQALVDAQDGSLAYGKAPGDDLYRAVVLVATMGGVSFVATTVLQNLDRISGDNVLGALGIVAVILGLIVRWGYRQFRLGGIVEEGTGLGPEAQEAELPAAIARVLEGGGR